jgi:hypothetical protein
MLDSGRKWFMIAELKLPLYPIKDDVTEGKIEFAGGVHINALVISPIRRF